ncbi:MAG: hypothetical protein ACRDRJ_31230, partial [Streptosporangiaceae bacterium]
TYGVHEIGLYKLDNALRMLADWLPKGPRARPAEPADADGLLAGSERSALVTVTEYTTQGSAEIAGDSTDLVFVRHEGRLHLFSRDPGARARLAPGPAEDREVQDLLVGLLA